MFEIKKLNEDLTEVDGQLEALGATITEAQRSMTPEETAQFDTLYAQREDIATKLETANRLDKVKPVQQRSKDNNGNAGYHTFTLQKAEPTLQERNRALCGWALAACGHKSRAKTDMLRSAEKLGYDIGSDSTQITDYSRAQSTSATEGGNTVSGAQFVGIVEKLKFFGGVREFASVENSPSGRPFKWAVMDPTARSAAAHTENAADVTNTSQSFSSITLNAFTYASGIFPVSVEILEDSEVNLEAILARILGTGLARKMNALGTTGAGTTTPYGVLAEVTTGVTSASASAVTLSELYNLYFSVDKAYRDSDARWMMSDGSYNQLVQGLVDDDGRPLLWNSLGSLSDPNKQTILGCPVIINNDMTTIATNASGHAAIVFGNGKLGYIWRDVGTPVLQVLRERYADTLSVAFQVYARFDGRQVDSTAYKALVMKTGGGS